MGKRQHSLRKNGKGDSGNKVGGWLEVKGVSAAAGPSEPNIRAGRGPPSSLADPSTLGCLSLSKLPHRKPVFLCLAHLGGHIKA